MPGKLKYCIRQRKAQTDTERYGGSMVLEIIQKG